MEKKSNLIDHRDEVILEPENSVVEIDRAQLIRVNH